MSIRPTDLPTLIQRAPEVDRIQQVRDQQSLVTQQQFGARMAAELEKREIRIKEPPKSADGHVDPDAKKERGREEKGTDHHERAGESKSSDNSDGAGKSMNPGSTGARLDIRI